MRYLVATFLVLLISSSAFAGGTIGTNPGKSLELMSVAIGQLPKAYVEEDEFRRTDARLSVDGTESVAMTVDGQTIEVQKLGNSIVDTELSKEVLSK